MAAKKKAASKKVAVKKVAAKKVDAKKVEAKPASPPTLTSSAILAELVKASKAGPQKKGEVDGGYVERVCSALSEATEKDAALFDKLSKEAQKFYDAVADAVNANKAVPLPPDMGGGPSKEAAAPAAAAPQEKAAKSKKAAGKATKNEEEAARREPRKDSTAYKVRAVVVENPSISFEDAAKKAGFKAEPGGHVWNIFNHAKCVMELAGEHYTQVAAKLK